MIQFLEMKDSLQIIWRWFKWPVLVAVFLYAVLVGWRVFFLFEEEKTAEAVAAIHAQKITLADVDGSNLPPVPDPIENDATVAGIDANGNGVRDDVELAIFEKYSSDKKARAAALQYAMTEQMYLTRVSNTETWKAVAEEVGRATDCGIDFELNRNEIQSLVFDTQFRKEFRTKAFEFITSHGDAEGTVCDVFLQ